LSKGILATGVIMLAVLALGVVSIINGYSTGNELDATLLRETVESAMLDSIDLGYYRLTDGQIRMDKEKFATNFTRRFAENVGNNMNYNIKIYDVNETPPKVTVKVGSSTAITFFGEDFDINNVISGIIETKFSENK